MMEEHPADRFDSALACALAAHRGQRRRYSGEPYITHPLWVASKLSRNPSIQIVGLLHDVLEDCEGAEITDSRWLIVEDGANEQALELTPEERDALLALTKREGEKYDDYLTRVMANPWACVVKKLDIEHNLSTLPESQKSLRTKYMNALGALESMAHERK